MCVLCRGNTHDYILYFMILEGSNLVTPNSLQILILIQTLTLHIILSRAIYLQQNIFLREL